MIEMLVVGQPQALHEWFHLNDIHTSHMLPWPSTPSMDYSSIP